MKEYNSPTRVEEKSVVALGSFDGLHIAHTLIMNMTKEYAKKNGLSCGVLLFDKIPSEVFLDNSKRIMSLDDKKELLADMDFLYIQKFDDEFINLTADEFARFLAENLNAKAVCAGFNYRFGKKASGDILELKKLGEKYGFEVLVADEIKIGGETISSTRIRKLIEDGDLQKAKEYLGREFFLTGKVLDGFKLGRTFGFPTVNLGYEKNCVLPKFGVYSGRVDVLGKSYNALINVGVRPTFERDDVTVESYLIDFDGDLYDEKIRVHFGEFLRPEIKFNNKEELSEQINKDIKLVIEGN